MRFEVKEESQKRLQIRCEQQIMSISVKEVDELILVLQKYRTRQFKLVWQDGKENIISGYSILDAFTNAGYGNGAISALDYYKEID